MAKKTTTPTAFDSILSDVYGNPEGTRSVSNMDTQNEFVGVVEDEKPTEIPVEEKDADDVSSSENNDDSIIPQDVLNKMNGAPKEDPIEEEPVEEDTTPVSDDETNRDVTDEDVVEAQQVGLLFDAIGQQFGWNMNDVDEKDRPLTVEDLTNYMGEVIKQNSKPQYADDRIAQLDEYVKNGGKFEDFYTAQQTELSYDTLDLENESNQKAVVTELLKYSGYSDEQIRNKISRYEDADMLQEESEDAINRLKEIKRHELEYAQKQQEELLRQQEEQTKQFYNTCMNEINSLTSIRGVQIPKEDRHKLIDYIFRVDQNGVSNFQKDYNNQENFINNLITTAYMTMKGDSFISTAKRDGESSATEKLRKLLRHSSKNHTTYDADEKPKSVIDITSRYF